MFRPYESKRPRECKSWLGLMHRVLPFALLMVGCAFETPPAGPPTPNRATFDTEVYPVLMRDCGFPDCHGNSERFFRVYGPGRARLDFERRIDDPVTDEEMAASFERTRSMLASATRAEDSLLLRKPLEVDRGGAPHMGVDEHGQDVYRSTESPGYVALLEWAQTAAVFSSGGP